MTQKKKSSIMILVLSFVLALSVSLEANTQLRVNAAGDLEIINGQGELVKILSNGSISQSIKSDNQAFKVSYGKDLKGRFTTIVYPEPEKPQSIALTIFNQSVDISSDAVLTVVAEKDLSTATLQSGVLGKIRVAGNELSSGNRVQVQNGSIVTAVAAQEVYPSSTKTKVVQKSEATLSPISNEPSVVTSSPAFVIPEPSTPKTLQPPSDYAGGKVRKVEGDVVIAPKGQDVVDVIRKSAVPPRLEVSQTVAPGSTIQTGPTGKAYVSPFPGAVLMIEPNSTVSFEELAWKKKNGQVERKLNAYVKEGSVISAIKGIDPKELDYRVKTPHGVAAARGTVYIVRSSNSRTQIVVSEGKVVVETAQGNYVISVESGNKITLPIEGPSADKPSPADGSDITAAEALLAAVQSYLGINDFGSSLPGDGGTTGSTPNIDDLVNALESSFKPRTSQGDMTPILSP
jgi:hypothetical protein